jgi:hypothetical protein
MEPLWEAVELTGQSKHNLLRWKYAGRTDDLIHERLEGLLDLLRVYLSDDIQMEVPYHIH